jgi:hypothetical protein
VSKAHNYNNVDREKGVLFDLLYFYTVLEKQNLLFVIPTGRASSLSPHPGHEPTDHL